MTTENLTAPAQDAEGTSPAPPTPAGAPEAAPEARYRRYPFLLTIPLGLHYGDYSPRDRYARASSVIEKAFTDSYALSADARIISLDPMNWDTCPGETLTTAIFGVFFEDVTMSALAEYAEFAKTLPIKELVSGGEEFLPKPDAWVPSQSEFAELAARVNARRAEVEAYRSGKTKAASELQGNSAPKTFATGSNAPATYEKSTDTDFNEWDEF